MGKRSWRLWGSDTVQGERDGLREGEDREEGAGEGEEREESGR